MNQGLRWGIYIGLFGVLFVPFIVTGDFFFPFITGKGFAFRIIVEIVFALWVILALRDPSVRPKRSALLYIVGLFLISLGISTVLAENPHKAFWSNFERMEGYITLLHLAGYFLVVSSVFAGEKIWKYFFNTSIGISVLVGLYGVAQLAGLLAINQGGVRVDATFGNATYLSAYMLFHVFLTLYALVRFKPGRMLQVGYGVALILQILMIYYAATRGTILGLVGGLFLSGLVFTLFAKGHPSMRKAGVGIIMALLVIAGGFFLIKDSTFVTESPVLQRIASISLSEGETRFTIWGMALEGFRERPVFGWGQEGFNYVFNTYYKPSLYGQEPWFDRAHNVFFDWLIAGGALGLLLYLSFFAIALWYLWKPGATFDTSERAIFTGLLAGYAFHNFFVFDNLLSYILFFTVLAYLSVRHRHEAPRIGEGVTLDQTTLHAGAALVLVVLAFALYAANVPGMTRAAGIINALVPYEEGIARNFEAFKKVTGASGMGRQEAHEQLLQFTLRLREPALASLATDAQRNEIAMYAREAFGAELARTPNDARLALFYGGFLRQVGDYAGARKALTYARELSPQKQAVLFELGALTYDEGRAEEALEIFKEAFESEPAFDQARVIYAAVALRANERELAEALLTERFGVATPDHPLILEAYAAIGDAESVVALLEGRVRGSPENFDARLQLAGAYLTQGARDAAIRELEEAVRLNPEFTEQANYYIAEIRAGRNP